MAGADVRRLSADRRGQGTSFLAGVVGGALNALAGALLHPVLVLAVFAAGLTDSYAAVGLVPALAAGLWFLPRLLSTRPLRWRRKLPWLIAAALIRVAAVGLLAYVASQADRLTDGQVLRAFFICYATYVLVAGFAASLSGDVAARSLAAERIGSFFGQRFHWGLVAALVAAALLRRVLGDDDLAFPAGYTLLFVAAALALLAAGFFDARVREPSRFAVPPAARPGLPLIDPGFRRFVGFRLLLGASALADPFYALYALRELNVPLGRLGDYLAAMLVAQVLAVPLWRAVAARQGTKGVLQGTALVRLLVPLVALTVPALAETPLWAERVGHDGVLPWAYGLVFVAIGIALAGQGRGQGAYLLETAPAERRGSFATLANMIVAGAAFAMVLGGVVVDRYGFDRAFLAAALVGLGAVFASGALAEGAARRRSVVPEWRLRRARG